MLLTRNLLFAHIPKTGGTWVRRAICSSVPSAEVGLLHSPPAEALDVLPDRLSFTFVRDPASWWRSYWQWCRDRPDFWLGFAGWRLPRWGHVAAHRDCPTYAGFMAGVLADAPGAYSEAVEVYAAGVARVGRFEHLAADLAAITGIAGPGPGPVNVTAYTPRSASTPELDEAIRQAERPVLDRFYDGRVG